MSGLWKSFDTWLLWLLPIVNIGFASGSVLMLYCSLIPDFRAAVQSYILTTVFSFIVLGVAPNLAGLTPALRWIQCRSADMSDKPNEISCDVMKNEISCDVDLSLNVMNSAKNGQK
jgi:hypothetical protein